MDESKINTRISLSKIEGPSTDDFVSGLILSNNLSYNLCSFTWESVHLEKNFLSNIAYLEWKIIFPYI